MPGQPYLLRWAHSPYFRCAEGELLREASGMMILVPSGDSALLSFCPLDVIYFPLAWLASSLGMVCMLTWGFWPRRGGANDGQESAQGLPTDQQPRLPAPA